MMTVMLVLMAIMMTTGAVVAITMFMPRLVRRQSDFIRAKAIAEAGINEAYSRLVDDLSLYRNPEAFAQTSFAGGSYHVRARELDDHTVLLTSEGRFGSSTTHTSVEVSHRAVHDAMFGPDSPWGHAVFSNGNLRFNGTPPKITASMHTNQTFRVSGNAQNIEGTVTARVIDANLPPEQIGPWQEIAFPQLTDQAFVDLHQSAQSAGAVRGGGTYRAGDFAGVSGNVIWFTGNVTFHGDFAFDGYVVVNGNVTFRGSGRRTVNGLLYVQGNVTCNGATDLDLTGTMMAGGNITFNGASSVFAHGQTAPPGYEPEGDTEDVVSVAVWRE